MRSGLWSPERHRRRASLARSCCSFNEVRAVEPGKTQACAVGVSVPDVASMRSGLWSPERPPAVPCHRRAPTLLQ